MGKSQLQEKKALEKENQRLKKIVLEKTAACESLASCSGGSDEAKTEITYQTGSSSVASNILPTSKLTGSGDSTLTATTSFTYNDFGNVTSEDGPLAGTTDTVHFAMTLCVRFWASLRQIQTERELAIR
ncbi:MAG: hypothetical protein AAGC95_09695 [Pseudomonadota bacterium]